MFSKALLNIIPSRQWTCLPHVCMANKSQESSLSRKLNCIMGNMKNTEWNRRRKYSFWICPSYWKISVYIFMRLGIPAEPSWRGPHAAPTVSGVRTHMTDSCVPQRFVVSLTRAEPQRRRFRRIHCLWMRSAPCGNTGLEHIEDDHPFVY